MLIASGPVYQPVTVIALLKKHGLSLKEAHLAMNRIAGGEPVFVELHTQFLVTLVKELSDLGIAAYGKLLPIPLAKIGQFQSQAYQINPSAVRYSYA